MEANRAGVSPFGFSNDPSANFSTAFDNSTTSPSSRLLLPTIWIRPALSSRFKASRSCPALNAGLVLEGREAARPVGKCGNDLLLARPEHDASPSALICPVPGNFK